MIVYCKKSYNFAKSYGKMQEWLNWPAWKASKPQKGFRGSNPLLSASRTAIGGYCGFLCNQLNNKTKPKKNET